MGVSTSAWSQGNLLVSCGYPNEIHVLMILLEWAALVSKCHYHGNCITSCVLFALSGLGKVSCSPTLPIWLHLVHRCCYHSSY